MLRTDPGSCDTAVSSTLTPVTTFLTTDAVAYLWFYVTGTNAGDVVETRYYSPNGQPYAPVNIGPWQPVSIGGNTCFTQRRLEIAGAAPATMLGQWRVEATYNGAPLFTLTFTITTTGGGPVLEKYMMLRTDPGDCNTAANSTLTPVTTFLTTDARAYLWFYVTGTQAGDVAATSYYSPNGQLYSQAGGPWQPLPSGGNTCFKEWNLQIAGAAPATMPGQWTVKATYNGAPLFTLTFTIAAAPTPLAIDTTSPLPNCNVGTSCSVTLRASGGSPPYRWSLSSGALPAGLSLDSTAGTISGTPSAAGTYNFAVRVTDSAQGTATKAFVLTVAPVVQNPTIQTSSPLPAAMVGVSYSVTLAATGGTPPYRWSLSAGSLPPGLSLVSATGVISGTPTAAGLYNFTVQVADNAQPSATASKAFALTVGPGLTIQTASPLPSATVAAAYSTTLSATGGTPPYRWSLSSGSLPPGLALDSTTGVINGKPSTPGSFTFTMRVTDNAQPSATATKALAMTVNVPACGSPSITGLAGTADPATQLQFGLRLDAACPLDLTGQVSLSFSSDAVVAADDPAIQFVSTHNRTLDFTIRAGAQQAEFAGGSSAFQTGTVAGTIAVRVTKLSEAGVDVIPSSPPSQTVRVKRLVPALKSAKFIPDASSFDVEVVGYSTPRQVTQGVFQFTPASGANLQTTGLTVTTDLANAFTRWYEGDSGRYGSQFKLRITFNVQGEVSAISAVSVTLSNGEGSSSSVTAVR
jgi:hypothetical protein